MLDRRPNCSKCGEPVPQDESQFVATFSPNVTRIERTWHFRCASLDSTKLSDSQMRKLYAWHLERITKRMEMVVQRTDVLKDEVRGLMRGAGNTEQEIGDFLAGFSVYDVEDER